MARLLGVGVRNEYGRMVWHRPGRVLQHEVLHELVDAEGYPHREWRPVHPMRAPQVIAAARHARAIAHRRQIGPVIPYHLKPYLAALELVAMMSLATRALEGDL
jgi:hypothetical protein